MSGVGGGSGMGWVVVIGELSVWEVFLWLNCLFGPLHYYSCKFKKGPAITHSTFFDFNF